MFKNIVISLDLADKQSLQTVLQRGISLAKAFEAQLHLLYIIPDFGLKMVEDYLPKQWRTEQKQKYMQIFEEIIAQYIPQEINVCFYIGKGAIYDEIIKYSENINANLIMISAIRPQLRDYMLGPNASKIVRHSAISVMVVRN